MSDRPDMPKPVRAQSSIEYLTTYIWAIIIITVVVAALFIIGVFSPGGTLNPECILPNGFSCQSFTLSSTGILTINLVQTLQSTVNVTSVGCNTNSTMMHMQAPFNPPSNQVTMHIGSNHTFTVQCYTGDASYNGTTGKTFTGYVTVNYTDISTYIPRTVTGKVFVRVSVSSTTSAIVSTTSVSTTSVTSTSTTSVTTVSGLYAGAITPNAPAIDAGQSVLLSSHSQGGVLPYSLQWYASPGCTNAIAGATTTTYSATLTGTYYYKVTDSERPTANVCSAGDRVTVNAMLVAGDITPASPEVVYGQGLTLTANPSSGTPPYTYQWYLGSSCKTPLGGAQQSTYSVQPLVQTSYSYSVTDSAMQQVSKCSNAAVVNVLTASYAAYCIGGDSGGKTDSVYVSAGYGSLPPGGWAVSANAYPDYYDSVSCTSLTGALATNIIYCIGGSGSSGYMRSVFMSSIFPTTYNVSYWNAEVQYPLPIATSCGSTASALYCVGGYNGIAYSNFVYYAPLSVGGGISTWLPTNSYPVNALTSCVSSPNAMYCIGGYNGLYTNAVYYAPVLPSGVLGTWTPSPNPYPISAGQIGCAASEGITYCVGGYNGAYTNAVYYASIIGGGAPTSWTATNSYPVGIYQHGCSATSSMVYCAGGTTASGATDASYFAYILPNASGLGTWTAANSLPQATSSLSCIGNPTTSTSTSTTSTTSTSTSLSTSMYAALYCVGGNVLYAPSNGVYFNAEVSQGLAGPWIPGNAYPAQEISAGCVSAQAYSSNAIYCVGGWGNGAYTGNVYYATLQPNLVPGTWTQTNSYTAPVNMTSCASTTNAIYCVGGYVQGGFVTSAASYSYISPAGGLGTWTGATAYPFGVATSCIAKPGTLYCVGGNTGGSSYSNRVYHSNMLSDNSLDTWALSTNTYPFRVGFHSCVSSSSTAYCIGGYNVNSGSATNAVYYSSMLLSGDMGSWTATNSYPASIDYQSCAATANAVYCSGGYFGGTASSVVYYAPILPTNALGTWTATSYYPPSAAASVGCVSNPTTSTTTTFPPALYCVGGYDGSLLYATTYYAPILPDSSLGTWAMLETYPNAVNQQSCTATANAAYCIAGYSSPSGYAGLAYYATTSQTNLIGTWSSTSTYPLTPQGLSCISTSGAVYCVGGKTSSSSFTNTAYYAPIAGNALGAWVSTNIYPVAGIYSLSCSALSGTVYCVGGYSGASYYNVVYYAPILSGGSGLGTWTATNSYPMPVFAHACTATSGYVYCVGGYSPAFGYTRLAYYAPVISGGGLGKWTYTALYPQTYVSYEGCASTSQAVYCAGGYSGSSYYSTAYYAPIQSDGSLGAWTYTGSLPKALGKLSCVT